ncbi:hypothetical protein N7452_003711 [Penicillium brevicompactum]|uniref:Uncharacterized protein n=1 Tax=Penicillium brevicompactum TaxID=5074 RepID=A0A9W9QU78_PENBR|nr:hypothetical protein N7452_003711 [Penicillium brevicompactum]
MAFDPFIQQIIEYPVLPTQHQSKAAQVLQSRYFLPPGSGNKDFLDALNGGIWYDSIEPNVSCPTGNCTWPSFRSVEMCTKCVDVDPSNVTLSHGDVIPVSLGTTTPPEQGWHIPVNISILDGTPSNYSIFITDQHMNGNYKRSSMTVPRYLYWIIDGHVDSPDDSDENLIPKQRGLGDLFGIDDPLTVTASAELDFSTRFSANISALLSDHKGQSTFLSDLMGAIKVTNVTECAFSICAKEYDISVQSGDSSVKVLDEDFGSLYTASSTSFADPKLCWKPSSSPMTNWNTTGQKEWFLDRGLKTSLVMDPANFEFCGVEPQNFYEGLVALAGNMSMEYLAEYRNTTDGISDGMIDAQTDIRGGYITWVTQGQNDIQDMIASSANAQRATYVGLEMLMTNIALSVSSYARKMSSNPIYGVVTTQDSYVVVRWQWLTLPAVLLVAGTLLLIATALISSRTGVRVWKSSTLPLMFHGLESEFIARNMMIEHGQCESVSEMEHVADGTKVDLGMSTSEGRTMLRGAVPASQDVQTVVRRPSRRRSF